MEWVLRTVQAPLGYRARSWQLVLTLDRLVLTIMMLQLARMLLARIGWNVVAVRIAAVGGLPLGVFGMAAP